MSDLTPLPDLASKLRELTGQPGPGYRQTYMMALDGRLPTVQVRGRRYVRAVDLPAVVAALGLTIPAPRTRGREVAHAEP